MKLKTIKRVLAAGFCMLATTVSMAQTYTYQWEGFEDAVWATTGKTEIMTPTGKWTTNKNVQSAEQAYEGNYSLYFSSKNGVTLPELTEGAGALVYYIQDTNRQVYVDVSKDGSTWTNVEGYKETTDWTKHTVIINDKEVRFVKIYSTSNGQVYLDNVVVSKADGTLADGTTLVPKVDVPYFTQDFEANGACPSSKKECAAEKSITVEGQGEWLFLNAYKGTNESYIADGSARDLRMLKNGSYVVTPLLEQGVARLHFQEGRTGKSLTVYGSTDGGATWTMLWQGKTEKDNTVEIYNREMNRLKITNESSSDADVDNICVTGFPEGMAATVVTGEVTELGSSKATVKGVLTDKGDKRMIEWGVCWSYNDDPTYDDHLAKAEAEDFSVQLTGIACETQIYYRAYALSMAGVAYGEVKTLTTLAPTVAVIDAAQPVVDETLGDEEHIFVRLSAQITDNGGVAPTEVGFCYNEAGNPASVPSGSATDTPASVPSGSAAGSSASVTAYLYGSSFSKSVPLQPQTTYHIRAYAKNRAGIGYSEEMTFTTPELIIPEYAHNVYYVSTKGDDQTGDGSEDKPFYSLQLAADKVVAGDTIFIEAGTYKYSARINMKAIGQQNSGMIAVMACGGRAVLDFSAMALGDNNQGIRLTGSYWYMYGLDICGAGDNGMLIERNKPSGGNYNDVKDRTDEGHDNVIENCRFYRNQDTGLQMKNLAENNKVINCDSYFNADPDHEDADGFAVKISHGTGNYFYGCRAWGNCDDGWDGFVKTDGGFPDDCTTTYENCWAFKNGYLEQGGSTSNGDGNGFKLGSAYGAHNAILNRCLAFENYQKGFDQNHNTGSMIFNNCTGFAMPLTSNKSHFTYRIDEPVSNGHEVRFVNCVAVCDGIADRTKSAYAPYSISGDKLTITTCDFNTLPADYQSIDPTGADAERDAVGNLPVLPFMRIAEGNTKLIDKGTTIIPYPGESNASVGILYNGEAPDLGCFETGGEPSSSIGSLLTDESTGNANLRFNVMRTATGLLILTIPGETTGTLHTVVAHDAAGRQIAKHSFYGNTTVINPNQTKGLVFLTVIADSCKGSAKVMM